MKNQAPELERQRCGVASKDKRALVLFLFGALMLIDELPLPPQELSQHHYALQQSAMPPHLIRLTAETLVSAQAELLEPLRPMTNTIPARYALFLQQPLPINRADNESLQLLPGVGPHLARAILQYIAQHGPLSQEQELLQVAGIGPKTLERLSPYICLEHEGSQP